MCTQVQWVNFPVVCPWVHMSAHVYYVMPWKYACPCDRWYDTNYYYSLQWRHNGCDGVSNHQPHDCLLNRLFRRSSKKTSKLRVTGHCAGNSPVTGEFPVQRASNAVNLSIWWRHHDCRIWNFARSSHPSDLSRIPVYHFNVFIYSLFYFHLYILSSLQLSTYSPRLILFGWNIKTQ